MAHKWKYQFLNQNEKKEEETFSLIENEQNFYDKEVYSNFNKEKKVHTSDNIKQRGIINLENVNNKIDNLKNNLTELIEYSIKPNDSLLSISLSCNCSVEELKRINKIIKDQEFYGLRYLKIPVRKYGLLSEVLIHQISETNKATSLKEIKESIETKFLNSNQNDLINLDQNNSINLENDNDYKLSKNEDKNFLEINEKLSSKSSSTNSLVINVGFKKTFGSDKTEGDLNKFLVYLDKDLEKMREITKNQNSFIEPLISDDFSYMNNTDSKNDSLLNCNGADCGLKKSAIIIIALIICILVPLTYTLIWTESNFNHHNHFH